MSLEDWLKYGWLARHTSSKQEIQGLLEAADRDLANAGTPGLSPDWQLNIAHNAALLVATAALAACGYRAARESHRYRVLQSLEHTLGVDGVTLAQLELFRKKRNLAGYERAGTVSEQEAREMIGLAERLRAMIVEWLRTNHPELLVE